MLDELNHWPPESLSFTLTEPQGETKKSDRTALTGDITSLSQLMGLWSEKERKKLETRRKRAVLQMRVKAEGQKEMLRGTRQWREKWIEREDCYKKGRHTRVTWTKAVKQRQRAGSDRSRETELDKDGQLRSPAVGLLPGIGRLDRHHLHHRLTPVEAVIIRRRCHHHGCGSVRGVVDELCLAEYRTGAVQDLWLHALAGQWVQCLSLVQQNLTL